MIHRTIILFLTVVLTQTVAHGQTWQWAKQNYGTNIHGDDHGNDIVTDPNGYSYVTGMFEDTVTFGTYTLHTPTGSDTDIFLAKYDPNGNVVWVRQAGGQQDDYGSGISIDNLGNCYVTGSFQDMAYFENDTVNAYWGTHLFIAKYDTSGNFQWVKHSGSLGTHYNSGTGIINDAIGNTWVTGCFQDSLTFDSFTIIGGGIFISKFNSSGNCLWLKQEDETNPPAGALSNRIAVDGMGNSYIAGSFSDSLAFLTDTLIASGYGDAFIAKYDINGNIQWARKMGGASTLDSDEAYDIVADNSGNIFCTGIFYDNGIFDTISIVNSGTPSSFVSKWTTSGNVVWAKKTGGFSSGLNLSNSGKIHLTGAFNGIAIFDNDTLNSPTGGYDLFVATYNASGQTLNVVQSLGSTSADYFSASSISSDAVENIYITGIFQGSASLGSTTLTSSGFDDILVAKVSPLVMGIPELNHLITAILLPNPFTSQATLQTDIPLKSATLTVGNCFGQTVMQIKNINGQTVTLTRENLTSGLYFVHLTQNNQTIGTIKFVITD